VQNDIETLITKPIHDGDFSKIFDTVYFGKSHYSKLIQIANLIVGIFRYYLGRLRQGHTKESDYWVLRLGQIITQLEINTVAQECFDKPIKDLYDQFEIRL
jgi:hypothetical protein